MLMMLMMAALNYWQGRDELQPKNGFRYTYTYPISHVIICHCVASDL